MASEDHLAQAPLRRLASFGLYAVMAHAVSLRTQEIGIRTALGAMTRDILVSVLTPGMVPAISGLIVGLLAAFALMPIRKSQLMSPTDPATLALASMLLIASAMLGCLIPTRRAMRVDPLVALRHE